MPDRYGRVWHLAEMCARCAAATLRSKIINGGQAPAPSGRHQTKAGGAPVPGQVGTPYPSFVGADASPTAAPKQKSSAPAATVPSSIPAQAASKNAPSVQAPSGTGGKKAALLTPSGKVLLSSAHATCLSHVWSYLASRRPGATPEARLLAFVCTLRAACSGLANLTAQDLSGMRLKDPEAALRDLTASGWLAGATPDEVLQADTTPVACDVPDLQAPDPRLTAVTKNARPRLSGWAQRIFGHKRLRKHSAEVKLLAAYTSSCATQNGAGRVRVEEAAAVACVSPQTLVSAVRTLTQADWCAEARVEDEWLVFRLDDEVAGFAPHAGCPPVRPTSRPRRTGGWSTTMDRSRGSEGEDERVAEARRTLGLAFSLDIERAMTCGACAADGVVHDVPPPHAAPRPVRYNALGQRESLTGRQAGVVQALLARVAGSAPRSTADVRLAAVWWAAHARGPGGCRLSGPRLARVPVPDAASALAELAAARWITTDVEAVLAASDLDPVTAAVPDLAGDDSRLRVGRDSAAAICGWLRRVLAHGRLEFKPSHLKLAALYVTAHSQPCGLMEGQAMELAEVAVLDSTDEAHAATRLLTEAGWLDDFRIADDGTLTARMSAEAVHFAANTRIMHEPHTHPPASPELNDHALTLIRGREQDIAAWVAAYRVAHRHGPPWKTIFQGCFGLAQDAYDPAVESAVRLLFQNGWLAGRGLPYGTRPGRRFHGSRRTQVATGVSDVPGRVV